MEIKTFFLPLFVVTASFAVTPAVADTSIEAITQAIPNIPQYTDVDIPLLTEKLPEMSDGGITVTTSTLLERGMSGAEVLRLIRSGQVELAGGVLTTVSGDLPMLDGFDLSGMNADIDQLRDLSIALTPYANEQLERFGIQILTTYPMPAQVLFCRDEFSDLSDLEGRKVRTFGNSLNDLVTGLGAQPVSIDFSEVYSALELGVVDCAITGTGSGAAVNWPEVTSYISSVPLSWALHAYFVNKSWWDGLDEEDRGMITSVIDEIDDKQWELGKVLTREGVECNTGNADACSTYNLAEDPMTEVPLADGEGELLQEIAEDSVLANFFDRCGSACSSEVRAIYADKLGVSVE